METRRKYGSSRIPPLFAATLAYWASIWRLGTAFSRWNGYHTDFSIPTATLRGTMLCNPNSYGRLFHKNHWFLTFCVTRHIQSGWVKFLGVDLPDMNIQPGITRHRNWNIWRLISARKISLEVKLGGKSEWTPCKTCEPVQTDITVVVCSQRMFRDRTESLDDGFIYTIDSTSRPTIQSAANFTWVKSLMWNANWSDYLL